MVPDDHSISAPTDGKSKPGSAIHHARTATLAPVLSAGRAAASLEITASSAASPGEVAHLTSSTRGPPAPREAMVEVLEGPQVVQTTKNMTQGSAITSATPVVIMELAQSAGKDALKEQRLVALSA